MKVAVFGYSGHSIVAVEILKNTGYKISGYITKEEVSFNPFNLRYLGFENNKDILEKISSDNLFAGIGSNFIRKKIMQNELFSNCIFINAISKYSFVSKYSLLDVGIFIGNGARVNPFAKIGKGTIINTGSIIEHECEISNYVHIAPGAVLAGNVIVGDSTFIGANATIKQGVTIGNNVLIGAGSVVLKNIPDNEIWVGNPAKILKK